MGDMISLSPALLEEQSRRMQSLKTSYEGLFQQLSADLDGINSSWSAALANNFSVKIRSAQQSFAGVSGMLQNGADAAYLAASMLQQQDTDLSSRIGASLADSLAAEIAVSAGGIHFPENFAGVSGLAGEIAPDPWGDIPEGTDSVLERMEREEFAASKGLIVSDVGGQEYYSVNYAGKLKSQNQYDGPQFGYGYNNVGCTATAWSSGMSILTGKEYNPTSYTFWEPGVGATWAGTSGKVEGDQSTALSTAYNELMQGKPSVYYGSMHNGTSHAVLVVGVRAGADPNNLQPSDFLVGDSGRYSNPYGDYSTTLDRVGYNYSYNRIQKYGNNLP